MDTFSHSLWGAGLFGGRGKFKLALFFGAFPDISSIGLWLPINWIENGFGKPELALIPQWVFNHYNFSHSLLVAFTAIALVSLWRKDIAFAMLAWPLHIMLDLPFHSAEFFPTIIFWPVSDFIFDGIPWSIPWVWFSNLGALVTLYLWRWKTKFFSS